MLMKYMLVSFFLIQSPIFLCQQNNYLHSLFYGTISKDDFLISQKYSDVDSVTGFSYNPYIFNKRMEIVEWVWTTDFKQYHDTTKYYVVYDVITPYDTKYIEYIEVYDRLTMSMVRTFSAPYLSNTSIIGAIYDTDLGN